MIDDLGATQLAISAIIIIIAYMVRGITGFGSGLIAIPLLAMIMPLTMVVPLVGLLDYSAASTHGLKYRRSTSWKDIAPLVPFTIIGVISALYIFKTLDAELLRQGLAIFIISYAIYTLFTSDITSQGSRLWAIPTGFFGGFISALFGTGGPFYVIYMRLRQLDKQSFRATAATIFFIDGSSRILGYILSGFYTGKTLLLVALCLPVMILGMYIGGHIHTTLSQRTFHKAISMLLVISGTALLLI